MITKNPGTEIQTIFMNYKSCPVKSNRVMCFVFRVSAKSEKPGKYQGIWILQKIGKYQGKGIKMSKSCYIWLMVAIMIVWQKFLAVKLMLFEPMLFEALMFHFLLEKMT